MTYEQFLAWMQSNPAEAKRVLRAIQLQRTGGVTDPSGRNSKDKLTYEAFIAYLQRNPAEAKKQMGRINGHRGGGYTDPTDEDGYNTGNASGPSQSDLNNIAVKAGGGVTDPLQGARPRFGYTGSGVTPKGVKPVKIKGGKGGR